MDPQIKIVLINHSFQVRYFYRRWQLLAQKHPNLDVTLLAPAEYEWYKDKAYSYDGGKTLKGKVIDEENFHIRLFRLDNSKSDWTSPDFEPILKEIKPDVIYNVGTHQQLSLLQLIDIRNKCLPKTKLLAFSMRGPKHNIVIDKSPCSPVRRIKRRLVYLYQKSLLRKVNRNCDAIFCHYPDAFDCFRKEGYKGALYMQTQVGVNEEWFHEDLEARKEIRDKYNLGDSYVFGSASRFTPDKGIDDILNALHKEGNWKYLMMGTGSEEDLNRLKRLVEANGLQDKVIMTGFVDWYDMTKYWNAVDCAIHVPHTTPKWVETFSLSVIQPQITRKPIIGNDSGSVPYQIGFKDMIVPEGDVKALSDKISWVLCNQTEAKHIGEKMYDRVHNSFTVEHLNGLFYATLMDILKGVYDEGKVDMAVKLQYDK